MIDVRVVSSTGQLPCYSTQQSAGMDVRAAEGCTIPANGRSLVSTGLCVAIPEGYEIQVRPRSGLALKQGITVLNSPGTIDSDYRGEIGVILFNTTSEDVAVKKGDRVAQLVLQKVERVNWRSVATLDSTDRGAGGFGSTGVE